MQFSNRTLLKKTGLIDKKKAKQVRQEKHRQLKQQKGKKANPQAESKQWAQKAQAEKAARDRKLNQQRKQAAEQKSIKAQIRQLIQTNRIKDIEGKIGFNFVDGSKIQRLFVTANLQDQLTRGNLAIVKLNDDYALVPADVAEKIQLRDASRVILCNVPQSGDCDSDNPYAEYKVPDDLMW